MEDKLLMKKNKLTYLFLINFFTVLILYSNIFFLNLSNNWYSSTYFFTNKKDKFELKTSSPFSNNPNDMTISIGYQTTINWFLWDDVGPGKYRVWVNDTNDNYYIWVNWMDWTNNTNLQVPINRTIVGIFNYTIEYNNSAGIFGNPDTVIIKIVSTEPPLGHPDFLIWLIKNMHDAEILKQFFVLLIGIIIGIGLILGLILYFNKKIK